jgi:hypothetical protein
VRAALALSFAAFALPIAATHAEVREPRVESALADLAAELDPRAASALASIDGTGRRLLAMRGYLRSSPTLAERWSWSAAEVAAYQASPEKHALEAAIAQVRCRFEAANPGNTLWVNPEFRSLDLQVERWNENETVGRAGENLLVAARSLLSSSDPDGVVTATEVAALRSLLLGHQPAPIPTLAAPGLSPHGRMRAIDFQVESSGRIVAGTDSAAIASEWIAAGWKARLQAAIVAADVGLHGPLATPDEPWHYDFRPEAGQGDSGHATVCRPQA